MRMKWQSVRIEELRAVERGHRRSSRRTERTSGLRKHLEEQKGPILVRIREWGLCSFGDITASEVSASQLRRCVLPDSDRRAANCHLREQPPEWHSLLQHHR